MRKVRLQFFHGRVHRLFRVGQGQRGGGDHRVALQIVLQCLRDRVEQGQVGFGCFGTHGGRLCGPLVHCLGIPALVAIDGQQSIINVATHIQCLANQPMKVMLAFAFKEGSQCTREVLLLLGQNVRHQMLKYGTRDRYAGNGTLV
ncbi:hypothetical protein D3C81_1522340 [compost metagenome]